jgi:hypothetical protein
MHTFTCGHTAPEPRNMGRGKARQERLRAFFARKCCECAVSGELAHIESLTAPRYTQEQIDRRINTLRLTYR